MEPKVMPEEGTEHTASIKWWQLASTLPCGQSQGDRIARKLMFRNMDENGNQMLTITEVERFLEKTLGQEGTIHKQLVLAFEAAKAARESKTCRQLNDVLDQVEFRQFLGDVKRNFFVRFLEAVHKEGDGKMNLREFTRFANQLANWGVEVDIAAAFVALEDQVKLGDVDKQNVAISEWERTLGVITWEVIEPWAQDLHKDFDDSAVTEDEKQEVFSIRLGPDGSILAADETTGLTADIDLASLIAMLPCDKYSKSQRELRTQMWNSFDASGNGLLTLVEVENGLTMLLQCEGKKHVAALSPAIKRAFAAAKNLSPGDATCVTRGEEFRLLLVYLKRCMSRPAALTTCA